MSNPTPQHPVARAIWEAIVSDDLLSPEEIASDQSLMIREAREWDRIAMEAEAEEAKRLHFANDGLNRRTPTEPTETARQREGEGEQPMTMHNAPLINRAVNPGFFDPPHQSEGGDDE